MLDEGCSGFAAADISYGSKDIAVWRCPDGDHTWCAPPNSLTNARHPTGCGVCTGKLVIESSSLAAVAPWLAAQWDRTANGKGPSEVAPNDNRRYWWVCPVAPDHRWEASPNNRYGKGSRCPACAGQQASSTNNLTLHPKLMAEWDHEANDTAGLDPARLTRGSKTKARWRCVDHGHRWEGSVQKRTSGQGCSYCSGNLVSELNSIAARSPRLAAEFAPDLNGTGPDQVSLGSNNRTIWWRCPVEPAMHVWQAQPNNRWHNDTGCPDCRPGRHSAQEVRLAFELAAVIKFNPDLHTVTLPARPADVDMVCAPLRLVIEFDGSHWHKGKEADDAGKSQRLRDAGWRVVRVREAPLAPLHDDDVTVPFLAPPAVAANIVLCHLTRLGLVGSAEADAYAARGMPMAAAEAKLSLLQAQVRTLEGRRLRGRAPDRLGDLAGGPRSAALEETVLEETVPPLGGSGDGCGQ